MTKKKNEKITKEINKEGFFYKYKNDKKYKAKIELTGYGILIVIILIFANIASPTTSQLNNNNQNNETNQNITNEEEKTKNLLDRITNNYQYDININVIKNNEEIINYRYHGRSYDNTLEINKDINNSINTYYKIDDYYYKKGEEDYLLATKEEIYDLISNEYIELNELLKYIKEASLDHVTNYSNGKKESLYTLYLRDIIINNKTEDTVIINITEENETLNVSVDYTNLIKIMDNTVKECKISYTFSNIDKQEVFFTLENTGEINE